MKKDKISKIFLFIQICIESAFWFERKHTSPFLLTFRKWSSFQQISTCTYNDPTRTRTWNLLIRSVTPYPLGHEANCHLPKSFPQGTFLKARWSFKGKNSDPARTRTWNLLIRSQTPYPFGHEAAPTCRWRAIISLKCSSFDKDVFKMRLWDVTFLVISYSKFSRQSLYCLTSFTWNYCKDAIKTDSTKILGKTRYPIQVSDHVGVREQGRVIDE